MIAWIKRMFSETLDTFLIIIGIIGILGSMALLTSLPDEFTILRFMQGIIVTALTYGVWKWYLYRHNKYEMERKKMLEETYWGKP